MGKRPQGKGKRQRGPITKRDPDAKRRRREEREKDREASDAERDPSDAAEQEEEEREDDLDEGAEESADAEAEDDAAADAPAEEGSHDALDEERGPRAEGAPWAVGLANFERKWTWLETRLLAVVLAALVVVLCAYFAMNGMRQPLGLEDDKAGIVFRALVGILVLGGAARFATRKANLDEKYRTIITVVAVIAGAALAKTWRPVGVEYFDRLLNWLQEGSSLKLVKGGIRGVSTRLTMMLSFVGASLACAAGTHIAIDIVVRFIPQSWRKPAHVAGCAGAALVCLVSSWGFLDYVAVTGMHAKKEATAGEKIAYMQHELGDYFFLYRKQLSLDLGAIPYVVKGEKWNTESRMNGRQWNEFLDKGGFVERFGKEKIDALRVSEADLDLPRTPIIRANPKNGEEGFLINALDLIFPFGFLMLGLRLLLRCILVMAGHHTVEDGGGRDDEREAAGSGDGEPQKEAA